MAYSDAERLSARDISVSFDGIAALSSVDLELGHGELLGLIGPNGAGKTTLVNVISGFQHVRSGTVHMGAADITHWSPARRSLGGLARTFQGARPFASLTVEENIEAAAAARTGRRTLARHEALKLLQLFHLEDHSEKQARALSYGLLRRLAIARALALHPRFLLLDEPAAGLDEVETVELADLLAQVRADFGCGILLIEHDVPLVMRLCDRIQVLVSGRTLQIGPPSAVAKDPKVIDAYLGSVEAPVA